MKIEVRNLHGQSVVHLSGYVNAVERESRELPPCMAPYGATDKPFYEVVRAGVFDAALRSDPQVGFMFNHKTNLTGSIKLCEDNIGLYAEAETAEPEVVKAAHAGKLRGWSFGFDDESDEWKDGEDGKRRRYLTGLHLREVSILTETPAYIATSVSVRSEDAATVTMQYRAAEDTTADADVDIHNTVTDTAAGAVLHLQHHRAVCRLGRR